MTVELTLPLVTAYVVWGHIDRKLAKYGYWWKELPDIQYRVLVGPGGYCRTVAGALEEIQQRLGYR